MAQDCGLSSEPAYLGALFHRIGWLAIHATIPTQSITINQIARDMTLTERADLEMRHLGFTHAHVGAKILSQWQLPETISDAIKSYLTPLEANASRLAGVVHCAVSLATQLENNIRPWHWGESVDSELSERLGLNWFAWQKKEKVIQQQRETADIITC
jgi:HD-like signal output (HDOD) protein